MTRKPTDESHRQRALATFANPSKEFLRLNPPSNVATSAPVIVGHLVPKSAAINTGGSGERKARQMNRTEARMLALLESCRQHREDTIRYEGITLRFNADGEHVPSRYTPDFFVRDYLTGKMRCIEVKGKQIWPKDREKFKGARAAWGEVFDFEMQQWDGREWTRIY